MNDFSAEVQKLLTASCSVTVWKTKDDETSEHSEQIMVTFYIGITTAT